MDSDDDEDQFAEHSRLRRDRFMMLCWWFQQHMAWVDEEEGRGWHVDRVFSVRSSRVLCQREMALSQRVSCHQLCVLL